jgi:glucan phosphoethanolaminetransferase (alkaline phosphatase superfamily)
MTNITPYIIALIIAILDIVIRNSFFQHISQPEIATYLGSIWYEGLILSVSTASLTFISKRNLRRVACLLVATSFAFVWVGSWKFYSYFNTLPGTFAFSYMLEEPEDFSSIMSSGINPTLIFSILGLSLLIAFAAEWSAKKPTSRRFVGAVFLLGILSLVLNRQSQINPGMMLPLSDSIFSAKAAIDRSIGGKTSWARLQARIASPLATKSGAKAPFNVLLIINESLRSMSLPMYGYQRDTMPLVSRWFSREDLDTVVFERAISNATMTSVSIPSLLTGISPTKGTDEIHRHHVIYEYVAQLGNTKRSVIASHSYDTGGFDRFIQSPALDYLWSRDIAKLPAFNNVGADDRSAVDEFIRWLNTLNGSDHFFSILHVNGTHHPYNVPKEFEFWPHKEPIDQYDNSIRYLDFNLDLVFKALETRGKLDNTLIIFTSDHGESFGQDGQFGHLGPFNQFNTSIPFIITGSKSLSKSLGDRWQQLRSNQHALVSNLDILPTILKFYNLDTPTGLSGSPLTEPVKSDRFIHIFNLAFGQDHSGPKAFLGIRSKDFQLLLPRSGRTTEKYKGFFDLKADPGATKDLFDQLTNDEKKRWIEEAEFIRNKIKL